MIVKKDGTKYIVPNCCNQAKENLLVILYNGRSIWELKGKQFEIKPEWVIGNGEKWLQVCFCPFCGNPLPEVELKSREKIPKRIMESFDGNYCSTCNRRLSNCRCDPPWMAWQIKK